VILEIFLSTTNFSFFIKSLLVWLQNIIRTGGLEGKMKALAVICAVILISIFFKNLFLYAAIYILNPIKNEISNKLRFELYEKMLTLPIGYFTEKRKRRPDEPHDQRPGRSGSFCGKYAGRLDTRPFIYNYKPDNAFYIKPFTYSFFFYCFCR